MLTILRLLPRSSSSRTMADADVGSLDEQLRDVDVRLKSVDDEISRLQTKRSKLEEKRQKLVELKEKNEFQKLTKRNWGSKGNLAIY